MISAGSVGQLAGDDDWIFIDVGFSNNRKTCGLIVGADAPEAVTFSVLGEKLKRECKKNARPLNLMIEAPLSTAFTCDGNPTGRSFEKRNGKSRYWYSGPGSTVLLATIYLLKRISDCSLEREVRLFEAFVSFREGSTSHIDDVKLMQSAVRSKKADWYCESRLKNIESDRIVSILDLMGKETAIAPVLVADH